MGAPGRSGCGSRSPRSSTSRGAWRRWPPPRAAWPGPTPPAGSPTRSWERCDEPGPRSSFQPACGRNGDRAWLGWAPAALHRHRGRRDERSCHGLRQARRHGHRQRPQRLLLYGAVAPGRTRSRRRPRRRQPAARGRGRGLDRDRGREPGAGAGPRTRSRADPPRCPAGRAVRREAAHRRRRHPRQDDDDGDGGLGAAGDRRRPGLLRRRRGAGSGRGRRGRQRRLGRGRVGRRRGRRERCQLSRAGAGDRRRHQCRDGPPRALGLAGRAAPRLSRGSSRRPGASWSPPTAVRTTGSRERGRQRRPLWRGGGDATGRPLRL